MEVQKSIFNNCTTVFSYSIFRFFPVYIQYRMLCLYEPMPVTGQTKFVFSGAVHPTSVHFGESPRQASDLRWRPAGCIWIIQTARRCPQPE